jgi:hypothetical protein
MRGFARGSKKSQREDAQLLSRYRAIALIYRRDEKTVVAPRTMRADTAGDSAGRDARGYRSGGYPTPTAPRSIASSRSRAWRRDPPTLAVFMVVDDRTPCNIG